MTTSKEQLTRNCKSQLQRWTLWLLLLVALPLCVVEILLRMMGGELVLYEKDTSAGYRLKPSQHVRLPGARKITINEWGVRDTRPFSTPTTDTKRVVVLGDSVTWGGVLIHQDDLFTSVAEQELKQAEVINAGVNGYSVAQMVALYRAHLTGLAPDMVVVAAIPRDFQRPVHVTLTGDSIAFPLRQRRTALSSALAMVRLRISSFRGMGWLRGTPAVVPVDGAELGDIHITGNVNALAELYQHLAPETVLHILLIPPRESEHVTDLMRKIHNAFQDAGLPWTNLDDIASPETSWYVDETHFSELGHQHTGVALGRLIQTTLDVTQQ